MKKTKMILFAAVAIAITIGMSVLACGSTPKPVSLFIEDSYTQAVPMFGTGYAELGGLFTANAAIVSIEFNTPTWHTSDSAVTISLYTWDKDYATSKESQPAASQRFTNIVDNSWLKLDCNVPAGSYLYILHDSEGTVGIWQDFTPNDERVVSFADGGLIGGSLLVRVNYETKPSPMFGRLPSLGRTEISYVPSDPSKLRDVYSDTWVTADDLGRKIEPYGKPGVNAPQDKKIGIFYFNWFGDGIDIYNHSKIYVDAGRGDAGIAAIKQYLTEVPEAGLKYWAEPYFGYYYSHDRWVIRKHALQLVAAGVDFIFFDATNNVFYSRSYNAIFEEYRKMREEGLMTPQVVFFLAGDMEIFGRGMLNRAWVEFYRDGLYRDLWFYVDGKPLVLGNIRAADGSQKSNFTNRESWAFNNWIGDGRGKWPWIAEYPQLPGRDFNGNIEQLAVAAGFHANTTRGRSYTTATRGTDVYRPLNINNNFEFESASAGLGLAFAEQWKRVEELKPKYVMITGWNEWAAGKWAVSDQYFANTYVSNVNETRDLFRRYIFVDNFNTEFSRDIEPMKNIDTGSGETYGFGDNYYYQMAQYIRRYKGARPLPAASGQRAININGGFEQWNGVGPEYRDTSNDTMHRDFPAIGNTDQRYINNSGRNDIIIAKVSDGGDGYLYFYVQCTDDITAPSGTNWMNLFINADKDYTNGDSAAGWHGYNFLINRNQNAGRVSVERSAGGWNWQNVGWADYKTDGSELMIRIALNLLTGLNLNDGFDFKWADNSVASGNIMEFMDLGDAAPNDRFNFRYTN